MPRSITQALVAIAVLGMLGAVAASVVIVVRDERAADERRAQREEREARRAAREATREARPTRTPTPRPRPTATVTPTPDPRPSWMIAETNSSELDLPGRFYASQGREHHAVSFSDHTPTPFCPGVINAAPGASPAPYCYASNPPSSGIHLQEEQAVDVGGGVLMNIPPEPGLYRRGTKIPRDAIPALLERGGVYVGYNCGGNELECLGVVESLSSVVQELVYDEGLPVVMAEDSDLPPHYVALASWTRVYEYPYALYSLELSRRFIVVHACRFDPDGACG